ncbi:MAG: dTMP kinase [Alphaproteobacteria bacterium]|nr:dTMP kinase [Alphaproteobacteria bacterium]
MNGGRFITFEGGEGAGKSTQISRFGDVLRASGRRVVETREPGGAPGAEEIRGLLVHGEPNRWDPMTETLLHFAARWRHLTETVWPALTRGDWVLSDRFADSTRAYQGFAQGLGDRKVTDLYALIIGDFAPDLTVVLDVPVEIGLARATGPEDRYERMGSEFHQRVRRAFLEIAEAEPERCVVIDAGRDIEDVAADVRTTVSARLNVDLS